MKINEEQIITSYPIDGAKGSSDGGRVQKLSVIYLCNKAIVARGILVSILHCGTPEPCLSAIYIVSSVETSFTSTENPEMNLKPLKIMLKIDQTDSLLTISRSNTWTMH